MVGYCNKYDNRINRGERYLSRKVSGKLMFRFKQTLATKAFGGIEVPLLLILILKTSCIFPEYA